MTASVFSQCYMFFKTSEHDGNTFFSWQNGEFLVDFCLHRACSLKDAAIILLQGKTLGRVGMTALAGVLSFAVFDLVL